MRRRGSFLRRLGLGVGVAAVTASWPCWLRDSFADTAMEASARRRAELAAAAAQAQLSGKPLLILVVVDEAQERWRRGRLFGEILNHGTDRELAPLALVEVVCATMEEARRVYPAVGGGNPLMLLVEAGGHRVTPLDADVPEYKFNNGKDGPAEEQRTAEQRMGTLTRLVRGAIWRDEVMLRQRAEAVARHLGPEETERLRAALREAEPPTALVDRGAALLASEGQRSSTPTLETLLGRAVVARLRQRAPQGSAWRIYEPCGPCGMGHTPARSHRFLELLVEKKG